MSTNVGKVNVAVDVNVDNLYERVHESIRDQVFPALDKLNDKIDVSRKAMDAVSSKSFVQAARDAGVAADANGKVADSLNRVKVAQGQVNTSRRDARALLRSLQEQQSKASKQEEKSGKVSEQTARRILNLQDQIKDKRDEVQTRLDRLHELERRHAQEKVNDLQRMRAEVYKYLDSVRRAHQDEIDSHKRAKDQIVKDALKASKQITEDHQNELDKQAKAEREATKAHKAEMDQRAKDRYNAYVTSMAALFRESNKMQRSQNKLERQMRRAAEKEGLISGLADIGRTTGALRHLAMPAGVVALSGVLSQLVSVAATASQSIAALPAGIAAIGAVSLTTELGLMGVDEALTALLENDPEKLVDALSKLAPGAQDFVAAIEQVMPLFEDLQKATQTSLFGPEVSEGIRNLAAQFQPVVKELTVGIADSLSDMFGGVAAGLLDPESQMAIYEFVGNIVNMFEQLEPAVEPLTKAIALLLGEGSDVFPQIAGAIADAAIQFSNFIKEASRSGELNTFLRAGVEALGKMVGWVQLLITEWYKLGPVGERIMPEIDRLMRAVISLLPDLITFLATAVSHTDTWLLILTNVESMLEVFNITLGDTEVGVASIGGSLTAWLNPLNMVFDMLKACYAITKTLWDKIPLLPDLPMPDDGLTLSNGMTVGGDPQALAQAKMEEARKNAERFGIPGINFQLRPGAAELGPLGPFNRGTAGGSLGVDIFRADRGGWSNELPKKGAGPDGLTDSERKKQLEEAINIEALDPYSAIGGVQNMPGMPGRTPMTVTVDNMPTGGMFPGMPNLPGLPGTGAFPWDAVAQAESSGRWDDNNSGGHSTSSGAPRGGLQITDGTWKAYGGLEFAPTANLATREQQIAVAERIAWDGHNGTKPQGLGAWEAITKGMVPGVTTNTPRTGPGGSTSGLGGLMPATANLEQMIRQAFPMITDIGGVRQDAHPDHPTGRALDIMIPGGTTRGGMNPQGKALGDMIWQWLMSSGIVDPQGSLWQTDTGGDHFDHIHSRIAEGMENAIGNIVPKSFQDGMFDANGPMTMDPTTGKSGYFQVDQQKVWEAQNNVTEQEWDVKKAMADLQVTQTLFNEGRASELELMEAQNKVREESIDLEKANMDLAEAKRGDFKKSDTSSQSLSIDDFAYGDPRRAMVGALSGMGMSAGDIGAIMGAAGKPIGEMIGHVGSTVAGFPLPGPMGMPGTPTAPSTDIHQLAQEGNPMFWAQAAGFDVPDYTRQGGGPSAQNLTVNTGPSGDATGRMYSDTAALIDRTFTNMDAAAKARHDQVITVLNAVRDRLSEDMLGPVLEESFADGMAGMGDGVTQDIGTALGHSAGPIIAQYVAAAMPDSSGGGNTGVGGLVNTGVETVVHGVQGGMAPGPAGFLAFGGEYTGFHTVPTGSGPLGELYDEGGLWPSGTFGTNLSGAPERVLSPSETTLFDAGLLGGWNLQPQQQHFATVSGIDANSVIGADMFGVSQVPIIGAIINLLVAVLLKIIGVEIQARDTLNEISDDFRAFRGDFQAFDASGRMMNDTSGLVDRTGSSAQAAADERIRVLKLVIEGLIKFIIEKLIVPIGKAVANTAIQAGAQAASGAISGSGAIVPGGTVASGAVGSMVGSAISSAGSAATDIIADVWSNLATSITSVAVEGVGDLIQSMFPDLSNLFFGGGLGAAVWDPITNLISGLTGGLSTMFGAIFGGADLLFDEGGVASGVGMMPKATIAPERVLSPQQTALFERMVSSLERGKGTSSTTVHAPITVHGSDRAGRDVQDRLLALMS